MSNSTLLIGYGNPGRQDDGLGPKCIEALEACITPDARVSLSSNYQLTVEDAYDISGYQTVIFIDASLKGTAPYSFTQVLPSIEQSLGSHQMHPEAVLQLCQTLYQTQPQAYILAIRGYEFDQFEEALSTKAKQNLAAALLFIKDWINDYA